MEQKITLEEFVSKLNQLYSTHEGLKMDFYRNSGEPSRIGIWMQKYLDKLSITEFSFMIVNSKVLVKSYKYELDPVGYDEQQFPYEIELIDESKEFIPDNIKSVKRNFLF